ncbi:TetR/AcrR family transcriptional regulator [Nocardia sp. CA2R105]|uniref:TetR/AcrR family transcriptional regulator n=1 Tax=Nocardia coffeae TaxID=2873381 RepID=UPI001CA67EA5|nr:TetR/AcrR family transcriptional regulator [Nocardia coffeae]MBY8860921.1 TetR/AcrR family transcriptional regulator [Nocardia coffeae]
MPQSPKANRGPSAGPANRQALIDAAREVFAELGYTAPMKEIARRAGVGQGSMYRHFSDRIALAAAVFEPSIHELESLAVQPDTTLADLFDRVTEQALSSAALTELMNSNRGDPRVTLLGDRTRDTIALIVEREQAAGTLGTHLSTDHAMVAVAMLATMIAKSDPQDRADTARRARDIFDAAFTRTSPGHAAAAAPRTRQHAARRLNS